MWTEEDKRGKQEWREKELKMMKTEKIVMFDTARGMTRGEGGIGSRKEISRRMKRLYKREKRRGVNRNEDEKNLKR